MSARAGSGFAARGVKKVPRVRAEGARRVRAAAGESAKKDLVRVPITSWYACCLSERVRLLSVWVVTGSVLVWSGRSLAAGPADRDATPTEPARAFTLRAGAGMGLATQSRQETLVSDENFSGPRFHVSAAFARMFTEHIGVGVRGMYGVRNAGADVGGDQKAILSTPPSYSERFAAVAVEVPIVFELDARHSATVSLVPFAGPGWGSVGFYRGGPWLGGALFGGEGEIFVPRVHLGVALGAYFLPLPAPGRTGGHNDLGSYFISLIVGADVG